MKNLILVINLFAAVMAAAQTTNPPVFGPSNSDSGGAVGMQWTSQSNLIYRIDYASTLVNSNMNWQTLYEDYPSHGTNTIWKDAGVGGGFNSIPHPNDTAMRFYRVVVTGTNFGVQPQVSVLSPTNSSVLSDNISVSVGVTSVMSVVAMRLYVDGQEAGHQMYPNTNFIINTAQFPNGPHKLFAVAETMDGGETTAEASAFTNNFTASAYVNVTFDNFISDFRGSAVFVEPSDGETLTFKANFAAYADWTLIISNSAEVTVRTVTGTGYKMQFDWDGKDDGADDLPADFYSATLSASTSTNTPPSPSEEEDPPGGPGSQSISSFSVEGSGSSIDYPRTRREATASGSDVYYPVLPPMPPVKQGGQWHEWEEIFGSLPLSEVPLASGNTLALAPNSEVVSLAAAAAGEGTTTLIPPRIMHSMGTMGLAYQGHHPGTSFGANNRPANGIGGRVQLNNGAGITGSFPPLKAPSRIMFGFQQTMERNGYRLGWGRADDNIIASDLRGPQYGGSNQFNRFNIGLLVGHGVFGSETSSGLDYTVSTPTKLTYFPVYKTGVNSYDWVRFNEFQFGAPGSALRWMGILTCNNMIDHCYDDMYNKEVLPIGDDLHLLLGASSTVYIVSNFGWQYASALTGQNGVQRLSIAEAWFAAGNASQGFQTNSPKRDVFFRVAGWPACLNDDIISYSSPDSGNPADITTIKRQVYPPQ